MDMNQHTPAGLPTESGRVDVTRTQLVEPPERAGDEDIDVEALKTGTTTVGVKAEDGVVLITDMRASLGNMVSSKTVQKVEPIHDTAAITIAGSVSAAQSLIKAVRAEVNLYETRRQKPMSMQALSTLMGNLLGSGAYLIVSPLLGGVDDEGPHVYSLDPLGGITVDDYAATGSGSQFALGVLEEGFEEGLTMDDAEDVAVDAVLAATERDVASGNGLNIAHVTADGVDIERHEGLDEFH